MLMLFVYIAVASHLVSKADRKALTTVYVLLTFMFCYILFKFIDYFLMEADVIEFASCSKDNPASNRYQLTRFILVHCKLYSLYMGLFERIFIVCFRPENVPIV